MSIISKTPASLLEIIVRRGGLKELKLLSPDQQAGMFKKLGVIQQIENAKYGTKGTLVTLMAKQHLVSEQVIHVWLKSFKDLGWEGLVDGRRAAARGRALMPGITAQWIKDKILRTQRNDAVKEVYRQILDQWNLWRRTGDPQWAIPGFTAPPQDCGKGYPSGFSYESVRRCKPTDYQASLARQGTQASYRSLPSILGTRVGHKYLETIFFDDQKYDVQVRVPGYDRPMVPLGFNALDRLTAFPFTPHIRLRWYDCEAEVNRSLTQKEFVWYLITILCTEGYRTDEVGTTLIQEHGTAKAWSNKQFTTPDGYHSFQEALSALTGGSVRMDDSGLFNKPAFKELLYGPKSSGNPRFKAPIESFFHAVRTYMLPMIGQTGRNPDEAPEENYGIDQYERRLLKIAETLPKNLRDGILSNYLTGVEFGQMTMLAYDALANRTDHAMEGWAKCNHVEPVWKWKHEKDSDIWRPRSELIGLPEHVRAHALHEQSQDPRLTDCIAWSPAIARAHHLLDPAISKLDFSDAVHLLPREWAKAVKVRDRHQIHLTEALLPGEELIYLPELTTPRGRTEYLQPGDEVMVHLNPLMPDTLLCYDKQFAFIGTLTRNVRIGHDNAQLEEMYKQRSRLRGALDAPVRRAMQPVSDRRDAVATANRDYIDRAQGKIPAGSPEARSESAKQGVRTAAANRLQGRGEVIDYDAIPVASDAWRDPFADLPDDNHFPDSI